MVVYLKVRKKFNGPPAVVGRCQYFCRFLSILRSVLVFYWNCILNFFFNFGIVVETYIKLCVTEPDFSEKKICPQNWENRPKKFDSSNRFCFFYFSEKIGPVMKIHINCCVPSQTPYLRRVLFLRYESKCSQPIIFQDCLINHISRVNG